MEDDALLAERLQMEENNMGEMPGDEDFAAQAVARQRALNAQRNQGGTFLFGSRQDDNVSIEQYAAVTTFLIDISILLVIVLITEICRRNSEGCGIPVILWIEIFFIIVFIKSTFGLNIIWILRYQY